MEYSLKQALLLSSQSQASLVVGTEEHAIGYKLVVETSEEGLTLKIYCVFPAEEGVTNVADKPHRVIEKSYFEQLEDFLKGYGFAVGDSWLPVENEI